ncbi:hypothetical protein G7Z17_g6839 [Cylindrodendrum hubeiense]|uniref:Pyrroloquinoline quinone-dependent pyranose dehydrogenase beta-propeller domain-containing protein n=1 Tax=Cylindrodendrum hubeiense TaxID=595255 RepID=A0A9P5HCH3_9HYPO|nr:hypothetical protein G7Z17_g6839 [Cylindrodendrum hubeiense]
MSATQKSHDPLARLGLACDIAFDIALHIVLRHDPALIPSPHSSSAGTLTPFSGSLACAAVMASLRPLHTLSSVLATAFTAALATSALLVSAADDSSSCSNDLSVAYDEPVAADGWSYRLVSNDLERPRGIVFDTEGALLVVDSGVGIVHLSLQDDGETCLQVKTKKTLLENTDLNHGIALSQDGRTLYASSANSVYSWTYDAAEASLSASSARTLVTNMSNSGHVTRTLLLSRKHPEMLLVSRGSQGNDDTDATDRSSGRSQLRAFNISSLPADGSDGDAEAPYDFLNGTLLGWGLRNSVGVAEHPATGGIWSVENSVDNLERHGEDIHTDNPGEELNFHGYLNGSSEEQGGNYGYPLCYAIWSTDDFPGLGDLDTGDQFSADQLDDDDDVVTIQNDDECNTDYVPPVLAFQAHTAPLDIKFNEDGTSAYVSFHGSWNRDDPVGYVISSISFKDGHPVEPSNSMDAATPILSNADLSKCPDECFRPVGLAWDSKDRLWFSSDSTGEIFVLSSSSDDSSGEDADSDEGESGSDDDSAGSQFFPPAVIVTFAAIVMGFFLA